MARSATIGNEEIRRAVAAREGELYDAMIAGDLAALDALLAEGCTYVHSNGVEESKASYLKALRDGLYDYDSIEAREVAIEGGAGIAAATGRVAMVVGARGGPKSRVPLLSTLVWIREGGDWRLWRRHATRLPEAEG